MATLAADSRIAKKGAGKAPLSTHPLFPAIVALWFAALLGLGSLILPTVLLERLVTVTGLSSLVPMAAPPLGFTARATLALGAAAVGALLGLLLARQVASSHAPQGSPRLASNEERTCRPISAHDELGEEGLGTGARPPVAQKRRSLAISEDNRRSAYLQHVPVPGEGTYAPLPLDEPEEALELGEFADAAEPAEVSEQDDTMTDGSIFTPPRTADDRADFAPDPVAEEEEETDPADALEFEAPSLRRTQVLPSFLVGYDFDRDDEPPEPHIAPGTFGASAEPGLRPFDSAAAGQPQLAIVEPEPDVAAAIAAGVDGRPLDDLGLVQLAARLGASIERRRALRASMGEGPAVRHAPVFAANPEDFDAAAAEDAAQARASFFTPQQAASADQGPAVPQAYEPEAYEPEPYELGDDEAIEEEAEIAPSLLATKPSTLRDLSFDEAEEYEEDSDFAASFTLPRQPSSASSGEEFDSGLDEESNVAEGEEEDDSEYSSLLAMKNPFQKKAEFVRIEEPEPEEDEVEAAVTFPSVRSSGDPAARPFDPPAAARSGASAQADPGDAERELRAALATLQRMSGAA